MSRRYWASSPHEGDFVVHSTGPWKDHKYINKDGEKYIYPGDDTSGGSGKESSEKTTDEKEKDQVKHMNPGYYIQHSDRTDYVVHSSGPWKKHKYLKKIGDGANAVYIYADGKARNMAGKVVGSAKEFQRKAGVSAAGLRQHMNKAGKVAGRHIGNRVVDAENAVSEFGRKAKTSAEGLRQHVSKAGRVAGRHVGNRVVDAERSAQRSLSSAKKKVDSILNKPKKKKQKKRSVEEIYGKKRNLGGGMSATYSYTKKKKKNLGGGISYSHD